VHPPIAEGARRLGGRLRMLASGGAALPAETQQFWERLGVRVVQGLRDSAGQRGHGAIIHRRRTDGRIGCVSYP